MTRMGVNIDLQPIKYISKLSLHVRPWWTGTVHFYNRLTWNYFTRIQTLFIWSWSVLRLGFKFKFESTCSDIISTICILWGIFVSPRHGWCGRQFLNLKDPLEGSFVSIKMIRIRIPQNSKVYRQSDSEVIQLKLHRKNVLKKVILNISGLRIRFFVVVFNVLKILITIITILMLLRERLFL